MENNNNYNKIEYKDINKESLLPIEIEDNKQLDETLEKPQEKTLCINDEEQYEKGDITFFLPKQQDTLQSYLKKISEIPMLTKEEELSLAIRYIEKKDLKAAHQIILSHLKLVAKIALSYKKNHNIPTLDIISEGNIGLLKALNKYNPELGYRFSTYAMWWIKASIQEYILKSWSMVKNITTNSQKKMFHAIKKIKSRIINFHNYDTTEEYNKIADELNCSIQDVIDMENRIYNRDISLNKAIDNNDSENKNTLLDTISSSDPSQEMILIESQDNIQKKQIFNEALNTLNERELQIIKARNLTEKPSTLDQLSKKFAVSKERIRQIEASAINKIKKYIYDKYQSN